MSAPIGLDLIDRADKRMEGLDEGLHTYTQLGSQVYPSAGIKGDQEIGRLRARVLPELGLKRAGTISLQMTEQTVSAFSIALLHMRKGWYTHGTLTPTHIHHCAVGGRKRWEWKLSVLDLVHRGTVP